MSGTPDLVVVGIVGRPHGVRGEVTVESRTDEPERRFAPGRRLRAESTGREVTVASARDHSGRLLVRFDEVGDRTAAEALRGAVLLAEVSPAEQPEHPEEFYDRQLVGLLAQTPAGPTVGRVTAVVHLPGQDLLEITTPDGEARLVPFVTALVPEIDLAGGRLTVVAIEGLLSDPDPPATDEF